MALPRNGFWQPDVKETSRHAQCSASVRGDLTENISPIERSKLSILYALEKYRTLIITGCGDTVPISTCLDDGGWGREGHAIVLAEPRKVVAISNAVRAAEIRGIGLDGVGKEVGYSVRFDTKESSSTTTLFTTIESLLQMVLTDPLLTRFSVVVVNNVHERSVGIDMLLALLKKIQMRRGDLRVVLTVDSTEVMGMKDFFSVTCTKVLDVQGDSFPVDLYYLRNPTEDYVEQAVSTIRDIYLEWSRGSDCAKHVVVFVPGADDAKNLCSKIDSMSRSELDGAILPVPLYASLPPSLQREAVESSSESKIKVIVATNTRITITGIGVVVDCGFETISVYDPRTRATSLLTVPISKSSANRRTRCAGRFKRGKCFRLYTKSYFNTNMLSQSTPAILRSDLTPVLLTMKAAGIDDVVNFQFLTPLPLERLAEAFHRLYVVSAISMDGRLTEGFGKRMAELPLGPNLSRMLLVGCNYGVGKEMAKICAMLEVQSIVYTVSEQDHTILNSSRTPFSVAEGDLMTLLNIFNAYIAAKKSSRWCNTNRFNSRALREANKIFLSLKCFLITSKTRVLHVSKAICRAAAAGFFANAAVVQPDGTYRTVINRTLFSIHPSSVLYRRFPRWIVFSELTATRQMYARNITVVDPSWLAEDIPDIFEHSSASLSLEVDETGCAVRRNGS